MSKPVARPRTRAKVPRASGGPVGHRRSIDDRFFRHLITSMRNGVLAITRTGMLAAMNDQAYRVLGLLEARDDIGRPFTEVLAAHPEVVRVLASAFELSHLPNREEIRLKASGKVIGYTLSHVLDAEGHAIGAALFFKDLTRIEQLVERERLRDRLAALGEMAAAIAHELKNPLAGIEVMAGLLRRQVPDSPDAQSILTDIINEAKMANATVLEVLEFVRPIRVQFEPTAISHVVNAAVTTAESKVARRGISVMLDVAADLPLVQADPHQLRQLFTNLLINAFEALDGRGTVSISARTVGSEEGTEAGGPAPMLTVEVADNGPGVPSELTDRIFSPFFTTKPQGSGLGLANVRKIVDVHDGRIDVSTGPGLGTRFRVTLPLALDAEPPVPPGRRRMSLAT